MIPKGMLSKIGGVLALVALLFLPLGGCGGASLSGFDVLSSGKVGAGIKFMLLISAGCAVAAFFLKKAPALFSTGGGGIAGLIAGFVIARQSFPIEMRVGAYLSMLGFILVLAEGFMARQLGPGESVTNFDGISGGPPE